MSLPDDNQLVQEPHQNSDSKDSAERQHQLIDKSHAEGHSVVFDKTQLKPWENLITFTIIE